MHGRAVPLALVSLFLLLPAAAEASPFATLQASAATIQDAILDGELEGAVWRVAQDAGPVALDGRSAVEVPGLSITAAKATVTIHHSQHALALQGEDIEPTRWSLANVTADGAVADAQDARLLAVPLSAGSALLGSHEGSLRLRPGASEVLEHASYVDGVPPTRIDGGSSVQVGDAGDRVRITGNVRLVVDGLDLTFGSDAGPHELHTRRDVEGGEATVGRTSYAVRSTVHEAVLELQEAVVVMPASMAFVRSAGVVADGLWSFEDARGSVDGAGPAVDETVAIAGDLRAQVGRDAAGLLDIGLSGSPAEVSIAGRMVTLAAADPPSSLAILLASLALVVVLAAAYLSLGLGRFRRLDHAMDRRDYGRALGLSRGFAWHPWLVEDATLVAAICLLALARPAEAGARLLGRGRWSVGRRPMRDFLLARADAALGRKELAARRLAQSLSAEPSLVPEAETDPVLAAILRTVRPPPPTEAYA